MKPLIIMLLVIIAEMINLYSDNSLSFSHNSSSFPGMNVQSTTTLINKIFYFDTLTYNFGTISIDDSVQHTFTGKNRGNQPIYIQRIQTSCPCETLKISYSNSIISSGSETLFKITYKHYSQQKTFTESINIIYRCGINGKDESVKLQINGFIH